jgi:restriction endonuclease Mrr
MWRQQWEPPAMEKVDAVLKALCDAFGFNPDQRYQFAPTDRPHEIYRRYYRWQRSVDSMEIESLAIHLKEEFGVDIAQGYPEITLGEIVRRAVDRDGTDVPPTSAKNSQ